VEGTFNVVLVHAAVSGSVDVDVRILLRLVNSWEVSLNLWMLISLM